MRRKTTDQFIHEARAVHGDKYDYSLAIYINSTTSITIGCPNHGVFAQTPANHTYDGAGCPACSSSATRTTDQFIHEARAVHGDKYDYSQVTYKNNRMKVTIVCPMHGAFDQRPNVHTQSKSGCPTCAFDPRRRTTDQFVIDARVVHGDTYDYSAVVYSNCTTPVEIVCPTHGSFMQLPIYHINSRCGCPQCSTQRPYSAKALDWLETTVLATSVDIRHASNGGEYVIPGTKYKVDGYCAETNTIYEFYGDYWHGNPEIYLSTDINPSTGITYGELYNRTIKRRGVMLKLGYNVVEMWEHDWDLTNVNIRVAGSQSSGI